ncbi:MAG: hypothetical protein H7839_11170 [Magnetococcus sp. YQC-5]
MIPISTGLHDFLSALAQGDDPETIAYACNYLMEERVAQQRQQSYEDGLSAARIIDLEEWLDAHKNHLAAHIQIPTPETFTALNALAAHAACIDETLHLIRIERLEHALADLRTELDTVSSHIDMYHNRIKHLNDVTPAENHAWMVKLARSLNANPNAGRPRFAALEGALVNDMQDADWPHRLRDRLGLRHLDPRQEKRPIPVVLMRYSVKDVLRAAKKVRDVTHPITMPTVLDHECTAIFCPSPQEAEYGRTIDLANFEPGHDPSMINEILHLRINYEPQHIHQVGVLTRAIPDTSIRDLRAIHIMQLQEETGRKDFGKCEQVA